MGFQMVPYKTLRINNRNSIVELRNYHKVATNAELPTLRYYQVEMLTKTVEALIVNNNEPKDQSGNRALILNAMTFYIRELIAKEYHYANPERSAFYKSLGENLRLTKDGIENPDNKLTTEDKCMMLTALREFMNANTYINGKPTDGYLPLQNQLFTQVKGFDAPKFLKSLAKNVHQLDLELIQERETQEKERLKVDKIGGSSYMPTFGFFKSQSTEPEAPKSVSHFYS